MRRRTLGQRLAIRIAAATAICLAVVAVAGFAIWALTDDAEEEDESAGQELVEQLVPAATIVLAGIVITVLSTRWLTRRATARIDDLVATAARVGAHDLSARLPVTDDGDELDELSAALNQMLARIDSGVDAQRRFAADASHELRTPLTAALSALEVARRRPRTSDEWDATAARTITELARLSTLVDSLLQLARADAGLGARAAVSLSDLVDRVCDALPPHPDVPVVPSIPASLTVDADAAALEIALTNLVANAIAHSPPSSPVSITTTASGGGVAISITDHGPGVAPADRARIFEPFTRGAAPRADRVTHGAGVGLGLAISRRIALSHGGTLSLSEAPPPGACFTLWLPT